MNSCLISGTVCPCLVLQGLGGTSETNLHTHIHFADTCVSQILNVHVNPPTNHIQCFCFNFPHQKCHDLRLCTFSWNHTDRLHTHTCRKLTNKITFCQNYTNGLHTDTCRKHVTQHTEAKNTLTVHNCNQKRKDRKQPKVEKHSPKPTDRTQQKNIPRENMAQNRMSGNTKKHTEGKQSPKQSDRAWLQPKTHRKNTLVRHDCNQGNCLKKHSERD